ncbi:hypothetical protein GCM10007389_09480 [Pontibacter akesuensis]|nr:hypothetical protein GCM10007389_09480 [Pontibacter akesuensis]
MFRRKRAATSVPSKVVTPIAGITPTTVPAATVAAKLRGVIPCHNKFSTGCTSRRFTKSDMAVNTNNGNEVWKFIKRNGKEAAEVCKDPDKQLGPIAT